MTYQEAKDFIDNHFDIVNPHIAGDMYPHMVLGSFIAPDGAKLNDLVSVYELCKSLPNDDVLLQMNLYVTNGLKPYIVFKQGDDETYLPLEDYISSGIGRDDSQSGKD